MKFRIALACTLLALGSAAFAQEATRKLIPVTGDVHLMQNDFHLSLVVPTAEGTVRVDPIEQGAGEWLNAALADMGAEPVTHLIYSHSHLDHASGGAAHPGATVIAHETAPAEIDGVTPDIRVGDTHALTVGGKTFELTYLGEGHGTDMLAVVVRPENVAFIVDVAVPKRLPYQNLGGADMDGWIEQLETAGTLEFEILAPGHGSVGTKADLDETLAYITALKHGVQAGLSEGRTVDEIKATLTLDAYSDWAQYEAWRPMNIEGIADYLTRTGKVN